MSTYYLLFVLSQFEDTVRDHLFENPDGIGLDLGALNINEDEITDSHHIMPGGNGVNFQWRLLLTIYKISVINTKLY